MREFPSYRVFNAAGILIGHAPESMCEGRATLIQVNPLGELVGNPATIRRVKHDPIQRTCKVRERTGSIR